jgi:hypothetical protein
MSAGPMHWPEIHRIIRRANIAQVQMGKPNTTLRRWRFASTGFGISV